MFSDLNPLGRDTAILEILIMLLGAFLIGFLTAWLIRKAAEKKEQSAVAKSVSKSPPSADAKSTSAVKPASKSGTGTEVKPASKSGTGTEAKPASKPPVNSPSTPEWEKEKAALLERVKGLEKEVSDNRSEIGRASGFRAEIKELKTELEELRKGAKAKDLGEEGKQEAKQKVEQEDAAKANREVIRMRAMLATQEAAVRHADHRTKQLEKENQAAVKERDSALEQLDDLQFKMDQLQRQVETMRNNTSKLDNSNSARSRQEGGNTNLEPITSLKGLGGRSAEFMEKLGINTMERLAEVDKNTVQYIARNLEKPVEAVQQWVDLAQEKRDLQS